MQVEPSAPAPASLVQWHPQRSMAPVRVDCVWTVVNQPKPNPLVVNPRLRRVRL